MPQNSQNQHNVVTPFQRAIEDNLDYDTLSFDIEMRALRGEIRELKKAIDALTPKPSIILTGEDVIAEYERITK